MALIPLKARIDENKDEISINLSLSQQIFGSSSDNTPSNDYSSNYSFDDFQLFGTRVS